MLLTAVMVRAGFWQLDRAEQKLIQENLSSQALKQPTRRINAQVAMTIDDWQQSTYQSIQIQGQALSAYQFLLDNVIAQPVAGLSQVGYDVLIPVALEPAVNDRVLVVLVNRGWVAATSDRQQLPDVTLSGFTDQQLTDVNLTGRVSLPERGFQLGNSRLEPGWPARLSAIDYQLIAQRLQASYLPNLEILPFVLRLDAAHELSLLQHWVPVVDGPEKHYSYAVQWFAMSLALIVLLLFVSYQKSNRIQQ